jgi:hypothetical protein
MTAGIVLVSVAALTSGFWLWWHREAPKTTTGLFLVAGLAFGGVLGRLVGVGLAKVFTQDPATTTAPGSGAGVGVWLSMIVAGAAIAATVEIVVKGMSRRRAKPRRWHPWLALALPTVAIAAGAPLVGPLMTGLSGGVANVGNAVVTTASTSHTGAPTQLAGHNSASDGRR